VARTQTWKKHRRQILEQLNKFEEEGEKVPKSAKWYYQKLVPFVYGQGYLGLFGPLKKIALTLIGLFKEVPREPSSISQMRAWAIKSTALAAENLMLAFRAYGFDSCPMEGMDEQRVKKLLRLPGDAEVVMVVGAGERDTDGVYFPRVKFERENFVKYV